MINRANKLKSEQIKAIYFNRGRRGDMNLHFFQLQIPWRLERYNYDVVKIFLANMYIFRLVNLHMVTRPASSTKTL